MPTADNHSALVIFFSVTAGDELLLLLNGILVHSNALKSKRARKAQDILNLANENSKTASVGWDERSTGHRPRPAVECRPSRPAPPPNLAWDKATTRYFFKLHDCGVIKNQDTLEKADSQIPRVDCGTQP